MRSQCPPSQRVSGGPRFRGHTRSRPNRVGRECAGGEAQQEQRRALSRDQLDDLARGCPECAANAELAFASRDLQREQAVQTDCGENKAKGAKGGNENEDEALGGTRARGRIFE